MRLAVEESELLTQAACQRSASALQLQLAIELLPGLAYVSERGLPPGAQTCAATALPLAPGCVTDILAALVVEKVGSALALACSLQSTVLQTTASWPRPAPDDNSVF